MSTIDTAHQKEVSRQGAEDAGRYFRYVADFMGFGEADAGLIRQTKPIIEKHMPSIVGKFYAHLLRFPPTRKFFYKQDGSLDQEYLELRMRHLTNFWLRTADAVFDDDYARYVDYVGRAHTSRGADPAIYISERYVIGQVGMMQHAISEAISRELRDQDDELEFQAVEAWDKLMMVILELLVRAYGREQEVDFHAPLGQIDETLVANLAAGAVAREQGAGQPVPCQETVVAKVADIPDGERKIVQIDGLSIGVFHHQGEWYALRNSCIHRGGPVATGRLEGDVLTCPWHGFQFDVRTGQCVADPAARLDRYAVTVQDGQVYLQVPISTSVAGARAAQPVQATQPAQAVQPTQPAQRAQVLPMTQPTQSAQPEQQSTAQTLQENEFRTGDLAPGQGTRVSVDGTDVAVFNMDGTFYAIDDTCPHADGPLSEGELKGKVVICPWHGSCFDVETGAVTCGPATEPVETYTVTIAGDIGRVEARAAS